jgi:hypothetical protein
MSQERNGDDARSARYEAWRASFGKASVRTLVEVLNREVGNPGWGTARADYLHALHLALLECGYDCSSVVSTESGSMSLRSRLAIEGQRIVRVT